MPQEGRIVGIDVSKLKVEACVRPLRAWLSQPSTRQGQRQMIAWLRENAVGLAVMEASGGYERGWAKALREAGIAVRIVDPKRVRYFAKSTPAIALAGAAREALRMADVLEAMLRNALDAIDSGDRKLVSATKGLDNVLDRLNGGAP
jgi:transposase